MDDKAPPENPPAGFNKLDLSQLQGFSFGTQWTQDKGSAPSGRSDDSRGPRDDRRDRGTGAPAERRDRRTFRKPAGDEPLADAGAAPRPEPETGDRGPRPGNFRPDPRGPDPRGPDPRGQDSRGPMRRDGGPDRGRFVRPERPMDRGPYDSPYFAATFYPEDTSFNTLVQTIRKSCRTIELFEIARTVIGKLDRFMVVLTRKPAPAGPTGELPPRRPIAVSLPDGLPFESEEAAVAHIMSVHLAKFFDTSDATVDPPKGNFQVVNRCTITGELLGPPNFHKYAQIVAQHHAAKIGRMSLEAYRARIESSRDPELIAQWLEKMKKVTRYSWKVPAAPKPEATLPEPSAPNPAPAAAVENPAPEAAPEGAAAAVPAPDSQPEVPAPAAPAAEAPPAPPPATFDSLEDARAYLLANARDRAVRLVDSARFPGKICESLPQGEIRDAVEGALERQRRFPLDTANALRGRLRREHFTIFKKGSKGVSYVCAVKRKFRIPGQTFADSIGSLINYVETNPMVRASELPAKFLGLRLPALEKPGPSITGTNPPLPLEPAAPEPVLTIDERARLHRLQGDLVWLVREGYVTEFIDGRLFAPPPLAEARKKEAEIEEHDPENFPEAPPADSPAREAPAPAAVVRAGVDAPPAEPVAAEDPAVPAPSPAEPDATAAAPGIAANG